MIGIAAVNRSALLTRLRVAAGLVARQLSATIAIEQVLAVAVLFAVSLLACIDPAE
jgi:putative copper export protein